MNITDNLPPQVLLIEDEEDHVELIRRALAAGDPPLALAAARTLREARDYLAARTPDLVITDLRLPDGDGMEILPPQPEEARFPVVVLTGCGNESAAVSALKQGALDYVVKSETTLADMGRIVHRALREWQLILDRRRAEERLRESEARYRNLFETAQAIVLVLDVQGRIVDFNPFMEDLSGYKIDEVRGRDWFESFLPQRCRKDVRALFSKAVRDVHTRGNVNTIVTKSGDERQVEWHDKTLKDGNGASVGLLAIGLDVTERKKAEEAIRKAKAELEDRVSQRTAELAAANQLLHHEIEERYAVEEILRQQEMDLSFALEAAGAEAFTWNVHGDWLRRSEDDASCVKRSIAQTLEQIAARVHPEDRWNWEAKIQAALHGSGRYESEHRLLRADGTIGWVLEKGKVTFDPAGKPIQLFGVAIDTRKQVITRQQIENLAAKAKIELAKLHAVIENMHESLLIADAKGNLLMVNHAAKALFGEAGFKETPQSPSQYAEPMEFFDQEGRPVGFADWPLQRVLRGETFANYEISAKCKINGKLGILSCNGAPVRDEQGAVVLGVLTVRDVTDQKQTEKKLSQERDNLLNVLEAMFEGVCICDREGNYLYVNAATRKCFGDPAGRKCYEYIHGRRKACPWCRNAEVLSGKIVRWEWQSPQTGKTYDRISSPLRNPDGSVSILNIFHDITDLKETEVRLNRLQDELAHVARVKTMGEMASGLAHELNQPLAAILLKAEVGAEKVKRESAPEKQHVLDVLHFVADQAHRSGEIIRRMRHFVRKNETKQASLDLADAVREVTALMSADLNHAGVRLDVRIEPSLPPIYADRVQFQQVLINLARNAIEAMAETNPEDRLLAIEARSRDGMAEIAVSDAGCGITEEQMEKLFDAFQSTKAGGMGLGLAICRSIIEAHGGRIRAAPRTPRGTSFIFTLPFFDKDATHEFPTYRVHCG